MPGSGEPHPGHYWAECHRRANIWGAAAGGMTGGRYPAGGMTGSESTAGSVPPSRIWMSAGTRRVAVAGGSPEPVLRANRGWAPPETVSLIRWPARNR